ncbi:hypothetical protein GCM10010446_32840 [Streptomyces enissocaesilis]|uniref:Transcriptional regulator LacI/GalR-like sensor domain-containing protein n=1 Tax=Streptomyces enissocaesilis TaxID=332589 RepID=A0ABN3XC98_9ACTN
MRGDWSAESGCRAGLELASQQDCTAVFAANDQMAPGLLRALHERGRKVPEDVSVIGFDDIPEAGSFLPPLTTVHQDFAEVGRRRVEGVLRQMRHDTTEHGTTLVPTRLVVRDSTAPPPPRQPGGHRSGAARPRTGRGAQSRRGGTRGRSRPAGPCPRGRPAQPLPAEALYAAAPDPEGARYALGSLKPWSLITVRSRSG